MLIETFAADDGFQSHVTFQQFGHDTQPQLCVMFGQLVKLNFFAFLFIGRCDERWNRELNIIIFTYISTRNFMHLAFLLGNQIQLTNIYMLN